MELINAEQIEAAVVENADFVVYMIEYQRKLNTSTEEVLATVTNSILAKLLDRYDKEQILRFIANGRYTHFYKLINNMLVNDPVIKDEILNH